MKTIEVNVYSFNELNEEAQQNAIKNFRNKGINTDFIYDDAFNSVQKFNDLFNIREGSRSWLDFNVSHVDDDILNLTGLRLRKYILNNFKLYKGRYYSVRATRPITHKRVKNTTFKNGNTHVAYYSAIQMDNSCILTGVCYDDDLMAPIYEFIAYKEEQRHYFDSLTFEELIKDCFSSLEKSIDSEVEYTNSDEAISEDLQANEYQFTEDGEVF